MSTIDKKVRVLPVSAGNRGTYSVCPICLKRISARRITENGVTRLVKSCPEHGEFSAIIWRGMVDIESWAGKTAPVLPGENDSCPNACGLCPDHRRGTCCTLLEVTRRCNMSCPYCFADGQTPDPGLEEVCRQISALVKPGKTLLQLSGGEPTVRDDLPDIIRHAVKAGCKYIQLNTNGIRLARQKGYARELAKAGLSFVFMQFDGLSDKVYTKLRGRKLMLEKLRAIKACAAAGLGVALVPMIVPGVNDGEIGDILRFAVKNSPAVRGVHFQPVSYFGRAPGMPDDSARLTLDELMNAIYTQAPELVKPVELRPGCCDHPLCGFHGDFIAVNGKLEPMRSEAAEERVCSGGEADRNREFIARRWKRPASGKTVASRDISTMEGFLASARECSFTVTAMAFQDAGNLDIERLRRCSLHVYDNGRFVPFCAYYLTAWENNK